MDTHIDINQKGPKGNTGMIPQPGVSKKVSTDSNSVRIPPLSPALLARFQLAEKLGSGSFGHIFKAFDKQLAKFVALKIEVHPTNSNDCDNTLTLGQEAKILSEIGNAPGIPAIYFFIKEENYSVLELELLGSNLEKLFRSCNRKFSLKTTLFIAVQMLKRIEYVHSCGFLHRDIKPENFMIGHPTEDPAKLYLIDFGLSKLYRDPISGKHISYKENKGLVGTARYASISTHRGIEQSRRDDLESIGYLLIYFIKGSLPWQNVRSHNKSEKYKLIADCKMYTSIEDLCKGLPREFVLFMSYVRNLTFTDTPDYKYLKRLFHKVLAENDWEFDNKYDWTVNFSKFEMVTHKTINPIAKQVGAGESKIEFLGDGNKANAINNQFMQNKANLKLNIIPPNQYIKQLTSAESNLVNSQTKRESKPVDFHQTKGLMQSPQKNNIQLRSSIVRHSNSIGGLNLGPKIHWNSFVCNANKKVLEDRTIPTRKIPTVDLVKNKSQDHFAPNVEGGNHRANSPDRFGSFAATFISRGFATSRNMMPEKPLFTACSIANGENDSSLLISQKEISEMRKKLKPTTAIVKEKPLINNNLERIAFSKTLQADRRENFNFFGEEIDEKAAINLANYQFPVALSMRRLEHLPTSPNERELPNRAIRLVTSPRAIQDCRNIFLYRNSVETLKESCDSSCFTWNCFAADYFM